MPPSLLHLFCASSIVAGKNVFGYTCPMPTNGCVNGMFSVEKCECECIPPYCLYEYDGSCSLPSGACDDPWENCTQGEDCPWWINPTKGETCATGPVIPANVWNLYNTQEACCNVNFLYSTMCLPPYMTPTPTKHPTIAFVKEQFEVIPLKLFFEDMQEGQLPNQELRAELIQELRAEIITVLKQILARLSESVPGLSISNVEERLFTRNLLRGVEKENRHLRELEEDIVLYFNVKVVQDSDGRKFAPLIIQVIKDSYPEIIDHLRSFAATKGYEGDINMNFCTSEDGQFATCKKQIPAPTPAPITSTLKSPTYVDIESEPEPEPEPKSESQPQEGLKGWTIALIVIFCLVLFCCLGYYFFASLATGNHTEKTHNNIYSNEEKSLGWRSRNTSDKSHRSHKSHRTNKYDETKIVLAESRSTLFDNTTFTHRSKKKRRGDRSCHTYHQGRSVVTKPSSIVHDKSIYGSRTKGDDQDQNFVTESQISFDDESIDFTAYGTRKHGDDQDQSVVTEPPIPFDNDSTDFTDYRTRKHGYSKSSTPTANSRRSKKQGRDPTSYIPDQEDKPDPEGEDDFSSRRYYEESSQIKPKRHPTIYGEDSSADDSAADPPLKRQRDPTVYVNGQREPSMYNNRPENDIGASFLSDPTNNANIGNGEYEEDAGYLHNMHRGSEPWAMSRRKQKAQEERQTANKWKKKGGSGRSKKDLSGREDLDQDSIRASKNSSRGRKKRSRKTPRGEDVSVFDDSSRH